MKMVYFIIYKLYLVELNDSKDYIAIEKTTRRTGVSGFIGRLSHFFFL